MILRNARSAHCYVSATPRCPTRAFVGRFLHRRATVSSTMPQRTENWLGRSTRMRSCVSPWLCHCVGPYRVPSVYCRNQSSHVMSCATIRNNGLEDGDKNGSLCNNSRATAGARRCPNLPFESMPKLSDNFIPIVECGNDGTNSSTVKAPPLPTLLGCRASFPPRAPWRSSRKQRPSRDTTDTAPRSAWHTRCATHVASYRVRRR